MFSVGVWQRLPRREKLYGVLDGSRATNGEHAAAAAAGVSTRSKGGSKGKARLLERRRWGIWTQLGLCSLL